MRDRNPRLVAQESVGALDWAHNPKGMSSTQTIIHRQILPFRVVCLGDVRFFMEDKYCSFLAGAFQAQRYYFFDLDFRIGPVRFFRTFAGVKMRAMLLDELKKYKVYLASKSPRRRELLTDMGIEYEILSTEVEESFDPTMPPEEVVKYLSRLKLSPIDFSQYADHTIFIACDTIVVVGDEILGKPKDADDAYRMLRLLSGREHEVISGLTVMTEAKKLTRHRTTKVKFRELSDEEIHYYIENYKPFDKAGAYGIQEWIGYIGITGIEGSFYNVMGFPTQRFYEELQDFLQD